MTNIEQANKNARENSLQWANGLSKCVGKAEFIKHLQGKRLSARQRLNAACCRCSSGYDIEKGCTVYECPLQPLNPYVLRQSKAVSSPNSEVSD